MERFSLKEKGFVFSNLLMKQLKLTYYALTY